MAIKDILNDKNNKSLIAVLNKIAESKSNVSVTPTVQWPDNAEVTVKNQLSEIKVNNLGDVLTSLAALGSGVNELVEAVKDIEIPEKELQEVAGSVNTDVDLTVVEDQLSEVVNSIKSLEKSLNKLPKETKQQKIEFPKITIPETFSVKNIDLVTKGLRSINDNIVKLADIVAKEKPEIEIPENNYEDLQKSVESVETAIRDIVFPVPAPSTPAFKNSDLEAASAVLQSDGSVPVTIVAGAGSGGTASADDADFTAGTTSGTPAMGVYESSASSVTDGDLGIVGITATRELKVSIEADNVGIGGGTQYTEDAVAAADPVGNAQILVREDSPVAVAADGDNVARRGTAYGAAYSQIVDSSGNFVDTFGGGTQYTEGDTDATITGTAMLMEGATNTLVPAQGTATDGLLVNLGSNNDVTVTGTVTANLGATDNAVLDAIQTATEATQTAVELIDNAISGTEMQVDIVSSALPSGAATAANQSTIISHVDGIEALLTTIDADTSDIHTNSDTIAAGYATEGSALGSGILLQGDDGTDRKNINVDATTGDVQVDVTNTVTVDGSGVTQPVSGTVTANLGATDNAVLDSIQAAVETIDNANATISSTDVVRVAIYDDSDAQITSFGGGTQYTEDAAAPTNPVGTAMMMERDDALGGITPIEGDWTHPFANANGALWVAIDDSSTVSIDDGGGTITTNDANLQTVFGTSNVIASGRIQTIDGNSANMLTALQTIDDSVFADDAAFTLASSSVTMAGAIRDDSLSTLTAVEGDAVPLRVSSTGALHVTGGGGGTEYTEDVATPNPIVGTATMMERDDALSTVTPIEGDWIGLRGTAEGALWTQDFNSDAALTAIQAVQTAVEGTLTVGSHAVTNAGTFAVQVDAALPAGTNAIGKLAANSGVDIGDVDILSVVPGTGATNLGKAEDAVHASGDVGVMALSVRQNTATALSGTNGDYQPLITDTSGRLHVVQATTTVGGATSIPTGSNTIGSIASIGTSITPGTAAANLGKAEDAVHASGDTGVMALGVRNDAGTAFAADGDYVPLSIDSSGALRVTGGGGGTQYTDDTSTHATGSSVGNLLMAAATPTDGAVDANDIGAVAMSTDRRLHVDAQLVGQDADITIADGGNSITVDNGGTFATQATLQAGSASIGVLGANSGIDIGDVTINNASGASAVNIQDGGNSITVDGTVAATQSGTWNVANTGTFAVQASQSTASNLNAQVVGTVAHDGSDSGNPVKVGGRAQEPTADLEEVADNDRVDAAFDRQGRMAVWMGYPVQSAVINTSTSGDNTIQAAAGAGKRIAVIGYHIVSDGTTDIRWEDGASGTAKTGQIPLQAREGIVAGYGFQPMWVGSANTLLNLELTAAVNVHGQVSFVVMED